MAVTVGRLVCGSAADSLLWHGWLASTVFARWRRQARQTDRQETVRSGPALAWLVLDHVTASSGVRGICTAQSNSCCATVSTALLFLLTYLLLLLLLHLLYSSTSWWSGCVVFSASGCNVLPTYSTPHTSRWPGIGFSN